MVVKLRKIKLSDIPEVFKIVNSPNVCKTLIMYNYPIKRKQFVNDVKSYIKAYSEKNPKMLKFLIEFNNKIVGAVTVREINLEHKVGEIAYWIGKDFWGKGITVKAVKLLTKYCFNKMGIVRLYATPFVKNKNSQKVLKKAGYIKEGKLRKLWVKNGRSIDSYLYAKIK